MTNNNDWMFILSLKEFITYFDLEEIIELSSISIKLRNKLKSKIFSCLMLERYPLLPLQPVQNNDQDVSINQINDQLEALSLNETANNNRLLEIDSIDAINDQLGSLSLNNRDIDDENLITNQNELVDNIEEEVSNLTNTTIESNIQKFKQDLIQFGSYPTQLNVFGYIKYFYIEEIAIHFNNLQYLDLSLISIPFNSLVNLFNTLSSLQSLRVNSIRAFKFNNQSNISDIIEIPKTLKKLNWEECFVYTTDLDEDPITFDYNSIDQDFLNDEALELIPQLLPNLNHLTYHSFDSNSQIITEFLELNPQIKSMECTYFGPILFTLISLLESFTEIQKLKLEFYLSTPSDLPTYTFPILNNLTTLTFDYYDNLGFGIISKICQNCPNLIKLSTIYYMTNCDLFNELLANLNNLKVLTLVNELNTNWELQLNPHLKLERLILKNFKKSNINFNTFINFKLLYLITFTVEGVNFNNNPWPESYINKFDNNWKFIYFRDCINCYKLI